MPQRSPLIENKASSFSFSQFLKQIGDLLPVSPQDAKVLKKDMIAAGIRTENAIQTFYGIKVLVAAVFLVGALVGREHMAEGISRTHPSGRSGWHRLLPAELRSREN